MVKKMKIKFYLAACSKKKSTYIKHKVLKK